MMNLFFLTLSAYAHSGGTDSNGCHSGTQAYHCHGAIKIDFDSLYIEGEIVKPNLDLIVERKNEDPCGHIEDVNDYVECSVNLSYSDIKNLCDLAQREPQVVLGYLDSLIKFSKTEYIYENSEAGTWTYQLSTDEKYYKVINSPDSKHNNLVVPQGTKAYSSIEELHTKKKSELITSDKLSTAIWLDKKITPWHACMTNGVEFAFEEYAFVHTSERSDFVALPSLYGECEEGYSTQQLFVDGKKNVCGKFKKEPNLQPTIFQNHHSSLPNSHNFAYLEDNYGKSYLYPISPTMAIYKNYSSGTWGIIFRQETWTKEYGEHYAASVFSPTYREAFLKKIEPHIAPSKNLKKNRTTYHSGHKSEKDRPFLKNKNIWLKTAIVAGTAIASATIAYGIVGPYCWSNTSPEGVYTYQCL